MYDKAKITLAQAEAIDSVWAAQHWTPQEFIAQHAANPNRWVAPCDVLNEMELDTLIRAFYIGYEVVQTPEEKLLEKYQKAVYHVESGWSREECFQDGMYQALNILNLKVKGINATK